MQWVTTTQILEDLHRANDNLAWKTFRDHFFPVVVNFAKSLGLPDTFAEDAAQETMLAFLKAFKGGGYVKDKGGLSDWIYGIARRVIKNVRRHLPREHSVNEDGSKTSFWERIEDDHELEQSWEIEWRKMVLNRCLSQVRKEVDEQSFRAFELYALQQKSADEVSSQLHISRNSVYIAKSRILSRLTILRKEFESL